MSDLLAQLEKYKKSVRCCVDKADHMIEAHSFIRRELDSYKVQMFNLKMKLFKAPFNNHGSIDLQNQIAYLEGSTFSLAELADKAMFSAIGRLGLALDELRSINGYLHDQTKKDLTLMKSELAVIALDECKSDIDDICERLIDCFVIEEGALKKILRPKID